MKAWIACFFMITGLSVAGEDAKRSAQPKAPAEAKSDPRMANLKLQQVCSDAADKFWAWYEANRPVLKFSEHELHSHSYSNHYNRDMGRCLVRVARSDWTSISNETFSTKSYEIFDAYEKVCIASLVIEQTADKPEDIAFKKFGEIIERSQANLDWYNGLMKK